LKKKSLMISPGKLLVETTNCRILVRRFPNSLCLAWKHLGRTCGWSKEVTEVSKGKGKASQKAMRGQREEGKAPCCKVL
jgi:hypothetical protein